jgi:hypothetical protein
MANIIGSRNATQVRSHAQKYNNRQRNQQQRVENQPRVEDTLDCTGMPMVSTRIRNGIPLQVKHRPFRGSSARWSTKTKDASSCRKGGKETRLAKRSANRRDWPRPISEMGRDNR